MKEVLDRSRDFLAALPADEDGVGSTAEAIALTAVAVGILVVLAGALQALGVDVIEWIRGQIIG